LFTTRAKSAARTSREKRALDAVIARNDMAKIAAINLNLLLRANP
jgi:hypothetical protein